MSKIITAVATEFAKMPAKTIAKASLEAAGKTALALGILKLGGMAITAGSKTEA